mgnify:CR=1 FL=1
MRPQAVECPSACAAQARVNYRAMQDAGKRRLWWLVCIPIAVVLADDLADYRTVDRGLALFAIACVERVPFVVVGGGS